MVKPANLISLRATWGEHGSPWICLRGHAHMTLGCPGLHPHLLGAVPVLLPVHHNASGPPGLSIMMFLPWSQGLNVQKP